MECCGVWKFRKIYPWLVGKKIILQNLVNVETIKQSTIAALVAILIYYYASEIYITGELQGLAEKNLLRHGPMVEASAVSDAVVCCAVL